MFSLDEFLKFFPALILAPARPGQARSLVPPGGGTMLEDRVSEHRLEGTQQVNGTGNGGGGTGHRLTGPDSAAEQAARLSEEWAASPRWRSVRRIYSAQDVIRLRGTVQEEHTLARLGAQRLWQLLHERDYVHSLGAVTGNQAVQQVRAGLPAIYLSGWQVAADANLAGETYPDQSLYPANSVPQVVPVSVPARAGPAPGSVLEKTSKIHL